jgi:hypothetical protein
VWSSASAPCSADPEVHDDGLAPHRGGRRGCAAGLAAVRERLPGRPRLRAGRGRHRHPVEERKRRRDITALARSAADRKDFSPAIREGLPTRPDPRVSARTADPSRAPRQRLTNPARGVRPSPRAVQRTKPAGSSRSPEGARPIAADGRQPGPRSLVLPLARAVPPGARETRL